MINLVIPVIDKAEEYSKIINEVASKEDVRVIVGVSLSNESKLNLPNSVVLKVFKDGSQKEEIINSLKDYLDLGRVVIARRPFTLKEFENIVKSDAQITYFQGKRQGSVKEFFKKLVSGFVKILFGVNFFDGDISLIGFDQDLGEVLCNVNSLSYATRVDRWRGVEQGKVDAEKEEVRIEQNKKGNANLIIFSILSTLIPVLTTILVSVFTKVGFIVGMLLFCFVLLGVCSSLFMLCTLYFNKKVGRRNFINALEV